MAKGGVEEQPFEPDRPLIDWKKDWPKILMGLSLITLLILVIVHFQKSPLKTD